MLVGEKRKLLENLNILLYLDVGDKLKIVIFLFGFVLKKLIGFGVNLKLVRYLESYVIWFKWDEVVFMYNLRNSKVIWCWCDIENGRDYEVSI